MAVIIPIKPAQVDLEQKAKDTSERAEIKAQFTMFNVARACYGSIENYVELIELQLTTSAFEITYSNEGYSITKRSEKSTLNINVRK